MAGAPTSPRGPGRYAVLLADPETGAMVAAGMVGRLPLGMAPLALILLLRGGGASYAAAGLVVAVYALVGAASVPLLGRLVDRIGAPATLTPCALGYTAALAGVIVASEEGAPLLVVGAVAACAGALVPPLGPSIRALWPRLLRSPTMIEPAYGLEAMLQEVMFVAGPLAVAAIAGSAGPRAALAATALAGLAGTLAFVVLPSVRAWPRKERGEERPAAALRQPGVLTLTAVSLAMGGAFGACEVSMPAFAEAHATRAAGGIPIAALALGSLLGGLLITLLPPAEDLRRRYLLTLVLFAVAMAPLLAAGSLTAMTALALLAGIPVAPTFASTYRLVHRLSQAGSGTESFAWISTAIVAGSALGTTLGGAAIASRGTTLSLLLAVGFSFAALAAGLARRRTI